MRLVRNKTVHHFSVLIVLLILSLLFLWPLPIHGTTRIIGGGGDPLLELWTLCWNDHWFSGQATSYFDANICHPEKNSLAFADHLFSQSLVFAPLYRITGNPVLSYNLLLVLTLALSGWGAYLCAGALGLSRPVSIVVGILFAFFPFRTSQIKHLHILSTQWLPFCFYFLLGFLRSKAISWRHLSLFTLFSILHMLCSFYQTLIWAVMVSITVMVFVIGGKVGWRKTAGLLCAGLVVAVVLAPFASAYFQVSRHYEIVRSMGENMKYSARPDDFVHASHFSLLYRYFTRLADTEPPPTYRTGEHQLYPGLVLMVLLVWGSIAAFRTERELRRVWLLLLATSVAALVFSFGPALVIGAAGKEHLVQLPYALLYHWLPGIKGLRVPSRLVLLFHFSGALLAGLGLQKLLAGKTNLRTWSTVVLLSFLVFLESVSFDLPVKLLPRPSALPDSYVEIGKMPEGTVLLELPTHAFYNQFDSMYNSIFHFHPLANGRSGIIPPLTRRMNRLTDPDNPYAFGPALLEHMLGTGINTVLLHRNWNDMKTNRVTLNRLYGLDCLKIVGRYDNLDILLRLGAKAGREEDVMVLDAVTTAPQPTERIPLKACDAYPPTWDRPLLMEVRDDTLCLGEQVYFCWFVRLPRGDWQLRLHASGLDHPDNAGQPLFLWAKIAGHQVLEGRLIGQAEYIQAAPVRVSQPGYYRISAFVQAGQPGTPLNLELDRVRLVPLSTVDTEPLETGTDKIQTARQ